MKRPLLLWCFLVVAITACLYCGLKSPREPELPDRQEITVTGKVYQKSNTSFYLKIQNNVAGLRQNSLIESSRLENTPLTDNLTGTELAENDFIKNEVIKAGGTGSNLREKIFGASDRLICDYDAAEELVLGSTVTLRGTFRAFDGAANPGEFDYRQYYHALGFAGRLQDVQILERQRRAPGIKEGLYGLRCYWERRLYRVFPEKEASVMAAILLGNKADVDRDVKELYRKNGMVHILSISGLHITLIGMGIYRLLRRLGAPVWTAAVSGCVLLLSYGVMTGLSVSVCRAIGMYLLRMLAILWGRTYDLLTALGVTAVVLILGNPAYLEQMGFLLSFGSVLGIGALLPSLAPTKDEVRGKRTRYEENGWKRRAAEFLDALRTGLGQGILAGGCVTLMTLPVQLWFTYEVPTYSVFLNVLILPFMSVVMIAGLVAMLVPGLGIVGTADALILAGYEKLCRLFERLPFHMWNPGQPKVWQIVLYYMLLVAVVWGTGIYRGMRKREVGSGQGDRVVQGVMRETGGASKREHELGYRILGAPETVQIMKYMALTISVIVLGIHVPQGDRVTFLDVGQGDCICVQLSSGEVYLFDCGSSSRSHVGEKVLLPFLKFYGIHAIDAVFMSHADADHVNGILELLGKEGEEQVRIGQIVLPRMPERQFQEEFGEIMQKIGSAPQQGGIPVAMMEAGDSWMAGKRKEDQFLCLHPVAYDQVRSGNVAIGGNAGSQCFYILLRDRGQAFSVLLTGDVEEEGEKELINELKRRGIEGVTALKVAHHGSRGTTSEEFLSKAAPVVSVISCGKKNSYGHPHKETLERLEAVGTEVFRTDEGGAITMTFGKKQIIVKQFRE